MTSDAHKQRVLDHLSGAELETLLRDSIAMENCKTYSELAYLCRNIEARHRVEGIDARSLADYEAEKARHTERVLHAVLV